MAPRHPSTRPRRLPLLLLAVVLLLPALVACGEASSPTASSGGGGGTTPTTASGSPGAGGDKGVIRIYSSWPLTGSSQKLGQDMVDSVKLAIEDRNGTVAGYTIEYVPLDDATAAQGTWDAGKEAENANKVVADPDAMVYIGTYNSGAAKISIPILNVAKMAMISPANTYPGLTKAAEGVVEANEPDVYYPNGVRNYCRVCPTDELQGAVAANWAKELGAQKVYVLDDTQLYGHGIAVVFANTAREIGLEVLGGPEGIDYKAPDYRALMTKIKSLDPDLIYFGGLTDTNAGKLVQDMRAVGMTDVMFMGPDGIFNDDFIKAAGPAAEGVYATFGGLPGSELTGKGADWYRKFKEKYGHEPDAYAAYAYEAASVALAAIEKAGVKDREKIREALVNTKDFDGLLGTWSFTETCDTTLTKMSGSQVKDGKWTFVKALEAGV
ncbi:MAG: branched-chain amino acid ABC transporter substrate-binding protein [Sphaerobacter sp.]|nr:branched-chain amino acid ABC transporter substrate-binding protein [Sphaerobacter sp.]